MGIEELQAGASAVSHFPRMFPVGEEKPQVDVGTQHQPDLGVDLHPLELSVALMHGPGVAGQAHDAPQGGQPGEDLDGATGHRPCRDTQLAGNQLGFGHAQPLRALTDAQARFGRHQGLVAGNQIIQPFWCAHFMVSIQ